MTFFIIIAGSVMCIPSFYVVRSKYQVKKTKPQDSFEEERGCSWIDKNHLLGAKFALKCLNNEAD